MTTVADINTRIALIETDIIQLPGLATIPYTLDAYQLPVFVNTPRRASHSRHGAQFLRTVRDWRIALYYRNVMDEGRPGTSETALLNLFDNIETAFVERPTLAHADNGIVISSELSTDEGLIVTGYPAGSQVGTQYFTIVYTLTVEYRRHIPLSNT
jgi:hypothetical protein